jgi:hypothetical protein
MSDLSRVEHPGGSTAEPAIRPPARASYADGVFSVPSSDKPDDIRPARKRVEPALCRGRENRIVRWIGAGNRKPVKDAEDAASRVPEGRVIKLSWADTFGRPARPGPAGLVRSITTPAQVLPFRERADRIAGQPADGQSAPPRAADQPSVPVLR